MSRRTFSMGTDGKITCDRVFIYHCGCGTTTKIRRKLTAAGISSHNVLSFTNNSNRLGKKYIEQQGYKSRIPELNEATFAVMINPNTRKAVDLLGDNPYIIEDIKEVYETNTI